MIIIREEKRNRFCHMKKKKTGSVNKIIQMEMSVSD